MSVELSHFVLLFSQSEIHGLIKRDETTLYQFHHFNNFIFSVFYLKYIITTMHHILTYINSN